MKMKITFIPAVFSNHSYSIVIPYTPIHSKEYYAKNTTELSSLIETMKAGRMDKPAVISITPLTRKMNGFDKWEAANRSALQINV